jgi:hypothetical protein
MCESSVDSDRRNFLRAGVLKKRSRIVIEVPSGSPASSTRMILPPLISRTVPAASSSARVSRCRRATEAIEGSASPRNPRVEMLSRSSVSLIFEVAWRSKASMASSRTMPQPLSVIWISFFPPAFDLNANARGTGVQRVLQQLLHHRRGTLDHLAGGDLVGDSFGKNVDFAHEDQRSPVDKWTVASVTDFWAQRKGGSKVSCGCIQTEHVV